MLNFKANGDPVAQPRVKACIRGKHASVYDPGTANEWKDLVKRSIANAWDGNKFKGAVILGVVFSMRRPKSHFRKNGELAPSAPRFHTTKPDFDNLSKAVADAITDCAVWMDDCYVVHAVIAKKYAHSSVKEPSCEVSIEDARAEHGSD